MRHFDLTKDQAIHKKHEHLRYFLEDCLRRVHKMQADAHYKDQYGLEEIMQRADQWINDELNFLGDL